MDDLDLLDRRAVCRLFGGTKPIDPATLYRGIASEKFPAPIKIGPGASRWLRSACEEALRKIIAESPIEFAKSKETTTKKCNKPQAAA